MCPTALGRKEKKLSNVHIVHCGVWAFKVKKLSLISAAAAAAAAAGSSQTFLSIQISTS